MKTLIKEDLLNSSNKLELGCFSGLAENYSKYRPSYSPNVLMAILGLIDKPVNEIQCVDVGAGTGIWSRMLAEQGVGSTTAVEPDDQMRSFGVADSRNHDIKWVNGNGEETGIDKDSTDLLTAASSFHWFDFNKSTLEFSRVLKKKGLFVALWNPRLIEENPLLVEIENKLQEIVPDLTRVSSGRSGITATLTESLSALPFFDDIIYMEGRHRVKQTPKEYIGVWRSVNDIQAQAGKKKFDKFIAFIQERTMDLNYIETTYLTRAWAIRRI